MHQFVRIPPNDDNRSVIVASFQASKPQSASHCSRVLSIPLRIVSNWRDLNTMFATSRHQAVARYEMPVFCLIGARLACDNDVFAMVFDSFPAEAICRMNAVRIVRIFSIQSSASVC